jgi:hypothetical protein
VLGYRDVVAAHTAQQMASEPLTSVEQLDHAVGDARFDLLAQQPAQHRVVVAVNVDVVVEPTRRWRQPA